MKRFLRSKLMLSLIAILVIVAAATIPLANSIVHLHAAALRSTLQEQHSLLGKPIPPRGSNQLTLHKRFNPTQDTQVHNSPSTIFYQSFQGLSEANKTEPSDVNAATGPDNVVEAVNSAIGIYDRNSPNSLLSKTSLTSWFSYSGKIGDPKIIYDPWQGRFIIVAIPVTTPPVLNNNFFLSVSPQGGSALGSWCNYSGSIFLSGLLVDFPTLGVDNNGIYFSANLYTVDLSGNKSFTTSELFAASRIALESCNPSVSLSSWYGSDLQDPDCFTACASFTIQPALMWGAPSSGYYEYLLNARGGSLSPCKLTYRKLDGAAMLLYPAITINTNCYSNPPPAPQNGTTVKLDTGDRRLGRVSFVHGMLDAVLTSGNTRFSPQYSVIDWFMIDGSNPDSPNLIHQGTIGISGIWYFYPSIQVDFNGNAIIVYNTSSSSTYESIYYIGLSSNGSLQGGKLLIGSHTYYDDFGRYTGNSVARWGDFQSAILDPIDPNYTKIWIAGQYARVNSNGQHYWSTEIAEVGA